MSPTPETHLYSELEIGPSTKVSAPLRLILGMLATAVVSIGGFTAWTWQLFNAIDAVEDAQTAAAARTSMAIDKVATNLEYLRKDVVDLKDEVQLINLDGVQHEEVEQWLQLMRARNPELDWADFPQVRR